MKRILVVIVFLLFTGCDGTAPPMKPGGGGLPQPYNPGNGQYVPPK